MLFTAITQVGVLPEQAPLQPTNAWPDAASAVSVTIVPCVNGWLQLPGPTQSSPAGLDVTVPEPPTVTTTVSACVVGGEVGAACPVADAV